jgi:hypothetical protein
MYKYIIYRYDQKNMIKIMEDEESALACVSEYAKLGKGFGIYRVEVVRKRDKSNTVAPERQAL